MSEDDRLQRMLDDPETYFAEARQRARAMIERDLARERCRRKGLRTFWKFGPRGWKS